METERADEIYTTILGLSIELEEDPTILGPRYLQRVTALCRNYLNQVTQILLQVQREKRGVTRQLAGVEAEKQVLGDQLLAENDVIKRLPNIKDREAQINVYLATHVDRINALRREILDLDTIEKAVRLRHGELMRTNDNIKTQRSLLHADRVGGSGYGDESPDDPRDSKGRVLPTEDSLDENEIDRLLREETRKVEEPKAEEPKAEEPKAEEPKAEEPKVEEPKVEEPKVEEPKVEEPKVEEPKVEEPKVEEPKVAASEDLFADLLTGVALEFGKEEPKAEEPKEPKEPKVEEPKAEEPKVEEPKAEEPTEARLQEFLTEPTESAPVPAVEKSAPKKTKPKTEVAPTHDDSEFDFSDLLKSM